MLADPFAICTNHVSKPVGKKDAYSIVRMYTVKPVDNSYQTRSAAESFINKIFGIHRSSRLQYFRIISPVNVLPDKIHTYVRIYVVRTEFRPDVGYVLRSTYPAKL